VDDPDPQGCYDRLRSELFQYSKELAHRTAPPFCIIPTNPAIRSYIC
jgi:hypothetical protein